MVSAKRVLLVGNESGFTQTVTLQLRRLLDQAPLTCRFDTVRQHVGRTTDGLILVVAGSAAEGPAVRTLLQELQLWDYPPRVVLLESAAANLGAVLGPFEPRLLERRVWKDNPRDLLSILREHAGHGQPFHDPTTASRAERLAWRVAASTPSFAPLLDSLVLAAAHDIPVLLTGESGTGKSFLARLIHEHSARAAHRFVAVSCRAIAPQWMAGELFGFGKGVSPGTDHGRSGKLALAGHGTIVLDEIDSLSLETQTTLLRVIETGEFEPVGGEETLVCNARIMATSPTRLDRALEEGTFRQDLFFRLNVITFDLPPLRERPQDIEPLVRNLVARFAVKFGKELLRIHPETLTSLREFEWPGNIRQLEHLLQQAVLLSQGPELIVKNSAPIMPRRVTSLSIRDGIGALEQSRQAAERLSILRALEENHYCRSRTAEALGISRVTLYKKMRDFGLLARPVRPRANSAARA